MLNSKSLVTSQMWSQFTEILENWFPSSIMPRAVCQGLCIGRLVIFLCLVTPTLCFTKCSIGKNFQLLEIYEDKMNKNLLLDNLRGHGHIHKNYELSLTQPIWVSLVWIQVCERNQIVSDVVVHAYNYGPWKTEVGRSWG